jgi:hypothetical protein
LSEEERINAAKDEKAKRKAERAALREAKE